MPARGQNFNKIYNTNLLKFVTGNLLHEFFFACNLKFPHKLNFHNADILIGLDSRSTRSIGKLRKRSAKLRKVDTIKVTKNLQETFHQKKEQRNR
jgi:hypothetical protein